MVNVSARVAALDASVPAMSPDLRRFLDLVWTNRAKIALSGSGSGGKLYQLYARRPVERRDMPAASVAEVMPFLERLLALSRHPLARPHWVQQSEDDDPDTIDELMGAIHHFIAQGDQDSVDSWCHHAAFTFYHLPQTPRQPAQARIYLNVPVAWGVEVMDFVVRDLLGMHADVLKAKLAGPRNAGADRLIIWVTALNRVDGILRALLAYQRTHRMYFSDGVPRLCQQAAIDGVPVRGVGLATEPAQPDGTPISFGKSRTVPIFKALDDVLGQRREWWTLRGAAAETAKEEFLRQTAAALRRAGIDPAQVHV
jgi:hypothetical protein